MALEDGEIHWFAPDPRGILPLDGFRVPRRLLRTIRQARFEVRIDTAFEEVIRACAKRPGTWINEEIIESYVALHDIGYAHSVEAWREGRLAGGVYGVSLRGAFFGESMFHEERDASKVALHGLAGRLNARGFRLLDTQWTTEHLVQFGGYEIPREDYLALVEEAMKVDCTFS